MAIRYFCEEFAENEIEISLCDNDKRALITLFKNDGTQEAVVLSLKDLTMLELQIKFLIEDMRKKLTND